VRLELAHILPVDFRINDFTPLSDFGLAAADRHHGNYLHKLDGIEVGADHDTASDDGDATRIDITTDGDEAPEENVTKYKDSVLANPVPGRVKATVFKLIESGLNAISTVYLSLCSRPMASSRT